MRGLLLAAAAIALVWAVALWPTPVSSHAVVTTTVTFDKEISRILRKRCLACHSEQNIGIPLTTYEETRPWAGAIHEEVLLRHMPPWRAVAASGSPTTRRRAGACGAPSSASATSPLVVAAKRR